MHAYLVRECGHAPGGGVAAYVAVVGGGCAALHLACDVGVFFLERLKKLYQRPHGHLWFPRSVSEVAQEIVEGLL